MEQRGVELGVEQGSADSSNYLIPIRAIPGAVFTSTGVLGEMNPGGGTAETEIYRKDGCTTGLQNANFIYGYEGVGEEDDIYEDINCGTIEISPKKREVRGVLNELPKSSARAGIITSGEKSYHNYVNVEEDEAEQKRRSSLDVGGRNKEVTAQIHAIAEESKDNISNPNESGNYCVVSGEVPDDKNEDLEKGIELECSNNGNDTVISDRFAENVRRAIEDVEKERCQGEERLERVLESLEEGMRREKEEGEQLVARIELMSEDTPRRSARLAGKQLQLVKKK